MKYSTEIQAFLQKNEYSSVVSQLMYILTECLDPGPATVWAQLQLFFNL